MTLQLKKMIYMPLYFERWFGSRTVNRLDLAAQGLFVRCLASQWDNGPLPIDPADISADIGNPRGFDEAWPRIEPLFPIVDGHRLNASGAAIKAEWDEMRRERAGHGRSGGLAKAQQSSSKILAKNKVLLEKPVAKSYPPTPTPTPTPDPRSPPGGGDGGRRPPQTRARGPDAAKAAPSSPERVLPGQKEKALRKELLDLAMRHRNRLEEMPIPGASPAQRGLRAGIEELAARFRLYAFHPASRPAPDVLRDDMEAAGRDLDAEAPK